MKFIKVPSKFYLNDPEEIEKYQEMGIKYELDIKEDFIYVNPKYISAINEGTDGNTTMRLVGDPVPFAIEIPIKEFMDLFEIEVIND